MSALPHAANFIHSIMEAAREMNGGDCQSTIMLVTNGVLLGTAKVGYV